MYQPFLYVKARVEFSLKDASDTRDLAYLVPVTDGPVPVSWEQAEASDLSPSDLQSAPSSGAAFAPVPRAASQGKNYAAWQKDFVTWLYGTQQIELFLSPSTKTVSNPGEDERDKQAKVNQVAKATLQPGHGLNRRGALRKQSRPLHDHGPGQRGAADDQPSKIRQASHPLKRTKHLRITTSLPTSSC